MAALTLRNTKGTPLTNTELDANFTNLNTDKAELASPTFTGTVATASLSYTGTLTGGTGVVNIGSGQVYKDASGNLGVGTTSPSSYGKFVVQANGASQSALAFVDTNTSGRSWFMGPGTGTGVATDFGFYDNTGAQIASLYTAGVSGKWAWYTNGLERMRLDASGNLGLEVTPSAWGNVFKSLEVGPGGGSATSAFGATSGGAYVAFNAFYNSSSQWIYKVTGTASGYYANELGTHKWYIAPSGTAGNVISFTQAMTLDASGNLLVGTTSGNGARIRSTSVSSTSASASFTNGINNDIEFLHSAGEARFDVPNNSTSMVFRIGASRTERMRLDASGNLGLGVTPSAWVGAKAFDFNTGGGLAADLANYYLTSNAYYNGTNWIYKRTDTATQFNTSNGRYIWNIAPSGTAGNAISFTQAMTLDASGNLGLGVTPSGSYKLEVSGGGLLTGLNVSTGGAFNTANTATFDTNGSGRARFYSRGTNASTVGSFQWNLQSSNGSVDTQAMTLHASGGLSVGNTTDPGSGVISATSFSGNATTATTLQTARTIGDVSFNGSANITPEVTAYKDTRSTNFNPFSYPGITLHLKTNSTDSLADGGTYHGVLSLQHWSDASGGTHHQLGFTDNNNLYLRQSTGATTWGTWQKVWHDGNLTNLNQLTNGPGYTTNVGTVTSVSGTGTVAGLSLGGTVTSSGNITLSGTLSTPVSTINDSTTVGQNLVKLINPTAVTFLRINADNTVSALDAATFRTAIGATNYSLPAATSTALGGIELFSDTAQTVAANAVSATASRTYGIQVNAAGQAVVNVPWTDTNSGGTVTTVSVASANGFAGTVATASSTPAITISTSVTGILYGNGSSVAAATANDFPTLNQNTTGSAGSVSGGTVSATTGTFSGILKASASLQETKIALAANNIDLATGNCFTKTISGATTLTVTNIPATGTTASFILDLTNGGSATITWWSGTRWAAGTAPTLTAAGRDVLGFFTHDGGTNWTGLVLGKDVK